VTFSTSGIIHQVDDSGEVVWKMERPELTIGYTSRIPGWNVEDVPVPALD
jgi:hypothetical protein